MSLFGDAYRSRRVLLTGHTGFKGSWMALWLTQLGAEVTGIALAPQDTPNHWDLLGLTMDSHQIDVRDSDAVTRIVAQCKPEIVFHLAAQSLVRRSYRDPLETWSSNVMGTVNLLEACRNTAGVKAIVVVTSDKCYENHESAEGYRESDRLGGHDPYSASKAAAELVVASYRSAYFQTPHSPLLASARAGNVIGGGDWCEDRLIPDLYRAMANDSVLEIRAPDATRPWQHVLESLGAYLLLGQQLLAGRTDCAGAWNFGPPTNENRSVQQVLEKLQQDCPTLTWRKNAARQPHETTRLCLDSSKAQSLLGWQQCWSLEQSLKATADWYQQFLATGDLASTAQLAAFVAQARARGIKWAGA